MISLKWNLIMIFQSLKWDDGASTVNKILSFTDKIFYKDNGMCIFRNEFIYCGEMIF